MQTVICCCGDDIDRCKRVLNALEMVTTGTFTRENEGGKFYITTSDKFSDAKLAAMRKFAEAACSCDEQFTNHRKFALFGPDGEMIQELAADNELDAVHEGLMALETECDVSEVENDDPDEEDNNG